MFIVFIFPAPLHAQTPSLVAVLTADDAVNGQNAFGWSVAIDGVWAAVGAPADSVSQEVPFSGAVYVFKNVQNTWTQQAKLTAAAPRWSGLLGNSVAMDGVWIVAGEPSDFQLAGGPGRAVVFRRSGETWLEHTVLVATPSEPADFYGFTLAMDGNTIAIAANSFGPEGRGAVFVYHWDGSAWALQQQITDPNALPWAGFGTSVAIDGDVLVIGDAGSSTELGTVHVYRLIDSSWVFETKLIDSDGGADPSFGGRVSVRGDVLLVGRFGDDELGLASGAADVFRRINGTWVAEAKLTASDGTFGDHFGITVLLAPPLAYIAAVNKKSAAQITSGFVYTFQETGQGWLEQSSVTPSPTERLEFGKSMDESDGHLIVGTDFERAYVYSTPPPIPAASGWTLLVLALLVATVGSYRMRNKRALPCVA